MKRDGLHKTSAGKQTIAWQSEVGLRRILGALSLGAREQTLSLRLSQFFLCISDLPLVLGTSEPKQHFCQLNQRQSVLAAIIQQCFPDSVMLVSI